MVLIGAGPTLTYTTISANKTLFERDKAWVREQRILTKENDALKKQSARNTNQYQDKVVINFKKWGGPYNCIDELEEALKKEENHDICVKQELVLYR